MPQVVSTLLIQCGSQCSVRKSLVSHSRTLLLCKVLQESPCVAYLTWLGQCPSSVLFPQSYWDFLAEQMIETALCPCLAVF